ncbi:MAG: recombination regulator RecX [Alphaproteobacteria bacterium]|nr:recombination regulator RecX [Alphaproteobacteria bacterium]
MFTVNHNKEAPQKSKKKAFRPPKKISGKYLHNSGLAYLQRFPASTHHFKQVMMRKIKRSCAHHTDQKMEECVKLLDDTVKNFKRLGFLDDEAYLRGMVNSLRRRGQSSRAIQAKLTQKGFTQEQILKALQAYDDENESGEIVFALLLARKKKIGPFDETEKYTPDKALAILARAGYSYDIAKKVLEFSKEESEEQISIL